MRFVKSLCVLSVALLLSACGGGGGGGDPVATPTNPVTPGTTTASNVLTLVVDSGPAGVAGRIANLPYATVTVCPPGSTRNCQTIDHVIVDTGSTGLRLLASALGGTAGFPQQANTAGTPLAQCATFISGYTWGSVRSADVTLGGLTASALPIQIIADPAYPTVPTACSNTGTSQNSLAELGAKGILGISHFAQDCGSACAGTAVAAAYYACPTAGSCTPTALPVAQQVANPIARLPSDNNGSLIQFPAVSSAGQTTATGALVLGIGTRANNAVGSAVAYGVNASTGLLSTTYNGRTYSRSAFDSGSNFYFFTDAALPTCTSSSATAFYCPPTARDLSAVITGSNGVSGTVAFRIANANALFTTSVNTAVLPDIGATLGSSNSFLWGMPFFYGRSVFTSLSGAATPLGVGPFVAF